MHDLIYWEEDGEVRDAIARKEEIKGWRREKKLALVQGMNPDLETLEGM